MSNLATPDDRSIVAGENAAAIVTGRSGTALQNAASEATRETETAVNNAVASDTIGAGDPGAK